MGWQSWLGVLALLPVVGYGQDLPTRAVDATKLPRVTPERFAASPHVKTIHVSPKGRDDAPGTKSAPLRTIRRALERTPAVVFVQAGTYLEGSDDDHVALRLEKPRTVVTAVGGPVVVRPRGSASYGLSIRTSHVSWRGISLEGFRSVGVSIGVEGQTLEDIVLTECTIRMSKGGDGIAVHPDHSKTGKWVVDGLALVDVEIHGADLGFTVGEGPARNLLLRRVVVKNRTTGPDGSGSDAIAVERGDNVLIDGVEVTGAMADGIDLKATRVAVIDAWVHHTRRNGIKLWAGGDIINALVHDCGADASIVLEAGDQARYRILNSLIAFHNRPAGGQRSYVLTVSYDTPLKPVTLELLNTVFYRNSGGLLLSKGTRATIAHCLFHNSGTGTVLDYGWDGSQKKSIRETEKPAALSRAGKAANNLPFGLDPRFRDPQAKTRDGFLLGKRSPLIGAGRVFRPFPTRDLRGKKRVRGRRPDLGPFEVR